MSAVWIVDDDQSIRFILEKALGKEQFVTRSFKSASEVLEALEQMTEENQPSLLLSDIRMPQTSGIELLATLKDTYTHIPVIIMTAYSDLDSTVSAFQGGAFEYIAKPFDLKAMVDLVRRGLDEGASRLKSRRTSLADEGRAELTGLAGGLIGQAPAMQEVFRTIGRLSQSDVTVMVTGESGSGKELVAQALHRHSPHSKGPFIAINTAAIPKDLLESELFGHEKGAFTGAQSMSSGRFEQAAGGTLFLDEIGDMSFDLQTRLLRVLSEGRFYRVGGKIPIESTARVIAATHQNLEEMVKKGLFREDLFHRLNVIRLRLPSLRERKEDIPLLVKYFLAACAGQQEAETKRISDEALAALMAFSFPGNVRQLENICHWLNVMVSGQVIHVKDLPPEVLHEVFGNEKQQKPQALIKGQSSFSSSNKEEKGIVEQRHTTVLENENLVEKNVLMSWESLLEQEALELLKNDQSNVWELLTRRFETRLICAALQDRAGKRIEAAAKLGIGRNTITRKIQDLGLDD